MLKKIGDSPTAGAWLLLALSLILFGAGLGLRDPWPADEPRFALIAKEMVVSGQWLFPTRGGELYPDKPPLFMWLIASFYWLTKQLNIAFLLPSLLAGTGTVLLVRNLAEKLWDTRAGLAAGLILLATIQFTAQAKTAQIDATLCFFIMLSMYGILRHMLVAPSWTWYAIGGFSAGLGVITKGVGFLPLLVLIPYFLLHPILEQRTTVSRRDIRWLLAPLSAVAAISLWLVPMWLSVEQIQDTALLAYRDNIIFKQTFDRYVAPWHHFKPWHYFLTSIIPVAWFPTIGAAPWLLPAWRRQIGKRDARVILLLAWMGMVLLFFSLSAAKRGVYILPITPVLAILAAPVLCDRWRSPGLQKTAWSMALLSTLLFIAATIYFSLPIPMAQLLVQQTRVSPVLFFGVLSALGLAAILTRAPGRQGGIRLAYLIGLCWLTYGWLGYPMMNPLRSSSDFMQKAGAHIGASGELAMVQWKEKFILHADRPIRLFGFHTELDVQMTQASTWLEEGENRWLLLPGSASEQCSTTADEFKMGVEHRLEWVLVSQCTFP